MPQIKKMLIIIRVRNPKSISRDVLCFNYKSIIPSMPMIINFTYFNQILFWIVAVGYTEEFTKIKQPSLNRRKE